MSQSGVSYDFSGARAIVTGGAAGIGRRVGERLSEAGAEVIVWDLDTSPLPFARSVEKVDVSNGASVAAAVAALPEPEHGIDILFHSAGWLGPSGPTVDYDPTIWRRIIDINLVGTYEVARHVLPLMAHRPAPRIVNMASIAGKEGTPNASAYAASKAGVICFTKSLAKELVGTPIRVNCLAPGPIETGMLGQVSPAHVAGMISRCPMGRVGTVDEAADLVLWVCSPACSYISGAAFDLSGGRAVY